VQRAAVPVRRPARRMPALLMDCAYAGDQTQAPARTLSCEPTAPPHPNRAKP